MRRGHPNLSNRDEGVRGCNSETLKPAPWVSGTLTRNAPETAVVPVRQLKSKLPFTRACCGLSSVVPHRRAWRTRARRWRARPTRSRCRPGRRRPSARGRPRRCCSRGALGAAAACSRASRRSRAFSPARCSRRSRSSASCSARWVFLFPSCFLCLSSLHLLHYWSKAAACLFHAARYLTLDTECCFGVAEHQTCIAHLAGYQPERCCANWVFVESKRGVSEGYKRVCACARSCCRTCGRQWAARRARSTARSASRARCRRPGSPLRRRGGPPATRKRSASCCR